MGNTVGNKKLVFTTKENISDKSFQLLQFSQSSGEIAFQDIRLFELPPSSEIEADFETLTADELAQKYPYINGDSVKSTNSVRIKSVGKNLFDVKSCEGKTGWQVDPVRVVGTGIEVSGYIPSGVGYASIPYKLKPNTQYTMSFNAINNQGVTPALSVRNSNDKTIGTNITGSGKKQITFMTDSVGSGKFLFYSAVLPVPDAGVYTTIYNDIQLEPGTVSTEYEPYKESIVNVNLPEPLRSVGSVKDEINVSLGKVTWRTGKYYLAEEDITGYNITGNDDVDIILLDNLGTKINAVPFLSSTMGRNTLEGFTQKQTVSFLADIPSDYVGSYYNAGVGAEGQKHLMLTLTVFS